VEVIAAAETWLDGQPSEFFLGGCLAKVRVWSLYLVSFLVGLRTYQHPGINFPKSTLNLSLKYHLIADAVFKKFFFVFEDKFAHGEDFGIIYLLLQNVKAKSDIAPNKPTLKSIQNAKSN